MDALVLTLPPTMLITATTVKQEERTTQLVDCKSDPAVPALVDNKRQMVVCAYYSRLQAIKSRSPRRRSFALPFARQQPIAVFTATPFNTASIFGTSHSSLAWTDALHSGWDDGLCVQLLDQTALQKENWST